MYFTTRSVKDPVVHHSMSDFGGLWKHDNTQHALVPPKTECGCPSGGGIKNGHIRYPSYEGTQKERKKTTSNTSFNLKFKKGKLF